MQDVRYSNIKCFKVNARFLQDYWDWVVVRVLCMASCGINFKHRDVKLLNIQMLNV